MKVLFITKSFVVPSLGILYVSSALKKAGYQVDISVGNDFDAHAARIKNDRPDFVAYSILTPSSVYYLDLNRRLKEAFQHSHPFKTVIGGPHPTYFPPVISDPHVDAIVIGEGEEVMPPLLESLSNHTKGNQKKSVDAPLIEDLDRVAFPDRELIRGYLRDRVSHFITARGCPYNCSYCYNKPTRVRFRSPENVIEEIQQEIHDFPTRMVYFQDDVFSFKKSRLFPLLDLYRQKVKIPFSCHVRADHLNEEVIERLKSANCYSVSFALESGNEAIRERVLNRKISNETILEASRLLHGAGIRFRLINMINIPGETIQNAFETYSMNLECRPHFSWCSVCQPYPGTKLAEELKLKYEGEGEDFYSGKDPRFNNLQRLFGIGVGLRIPPWIIRGLICLPQNRIFDYLHTMWRKVSDYRTLILK